MKYQGSFIAGEIDREYKQKKSYESKKRQHCKEKECIKCKLFEICTESEIKND